MNNLLTEIGNTVFASMSGFALWWAVRWHSLAKITEGAKRFTTAFSLITVAVLVRIGWWIFGLKLAPADMTYHPFFVEWKWLITVPASLVFAAGVILFVGEIEEFGHRTLVMIFIATILGSAAFALI